MSQIDELKGLVSDTLESQGILNKIRAQLRLHVFNALNTVDNNNNPAYSSNNNKLNDIQATETDSLIINLFSEFLSFYELDYTANVFHNETKTKATNTDRNQLASSLKLSNNNTDKPLLYELIERASNSNSSENESKSKQAAEALTAASNQSVPRKSALAGASAGSRGAKPSVSFSASLENSQDEDSLREAEALAANKPPAPTNKPTLSQFNTSSTSASTPATSGLSSLSGLPSLSGSKLASLPKLAPISNTKTPSTATSFAATNVEDSFEDSALEDQKKLATVEQQLAQLTKPQTNAVSSNNAAPAAASPSAAPPTQLDYDQDYADEFGDSASLNHSNPHLSQSNESINEEIPEEDIVVETENYSEEF
jgi:hypothetical protein